MLDPVHLRSFVAVAAELHFGRAARHLNMTQPPLSRQIRLLEERLGVPLFDRTSHSVRLTPAGNAFLPEARSLLQRGEAAVQVARRAVQTHSGALTLGFIGAATYSFLPRMVTAARAEMPQLQLVLKEMEAAEQLEALAFSRIDLGLVRPLPEAAEVTALTVMREGLALALPENHPLAGRRQSRLTDLHGEPLIMYSRDAPYLYRMLTAAFATARVQPRVVQEMSHAQAILSLVSTGMGLAIVPEEARNACFRNVVFRPLLSAPEVTAELHAIRRPGDQNPLLIAFLALLNALAPSVLIP